MTQEQKAAIDSAKQNLDAVRVAIVTNVVKEKNTLTQKNMQEAGALAANFLFKKLESFSGKNESKDNLEDLQKKLADAQKKVDAINEKITAITGEGDTSAIDELVSFASGLTTEITKEQADAIKAMEAKLRK